MHKGLIVLFVAILWQSSPLLAQTSEQWRDSLSVLGRAIEKNPHSVELRLRKAAVNLELNQWDYAIDEYGRVLDLDSRNLTALYFRAYANMQSRRYALAVADYERVLSIVPKHFEAQLGLAMATKKAAGRTETADRFNQLVQLFPDSALAFAARAGYEMELQQWDAALYDWDEAIRLSPKDIGFMVSKVEVLLSLGRKREAKSLLESAIAAGTPRSALKDWLDRCK
ncbi:MAG: tetratricopeptide repeat protein [Prevotella sp.]|nr:tetratricopeptide repeat protein [Prevotella sp.]